MLIKIYRKENVFSSSNYQILNLENYMKDLSTFPIEERILIILGTHCFAPSRILKVLKEENIKLNPDNIASIKKMINDRKVKINVEYQDKQELVWSMLEFYIIHRIFELTSDGLAEYKNLLNKYNNFEGF